MASRGNDTALLDFPWQTIEWALDSMEATGDQLAVAPGNGATFVVPASATSPRINAVKNFECRTFAVAGTFWQAVEIPGPSLKKGGSKELEIHWHDENSGLQNTPFRFRHSHMPDDPNLKEKSSSTSFETFHDGLLALIQQAVDLVYIEDGHTRHRRRMQALPWSELKRQLIDERDEDARMDLIVEIARQMPNYLQAVAKNPKRMLMRYRANERIHRIRQMDRACVIDMARRPGRTTAEKGGAKQQLLAVKREEVFDTLENRVSVDFARLARNAANRYMAEQNHADFTNRFRTVKRFTHLCIDFMEQPEFEDVRELKTPCRVPNYTLLQNRKYNQIWRSYLRLLKNEDVRDEVWRWQRRAWADAVRMFAAFALHVDDFREMFRQGGGIFVEPAFRPARFASEQFAGRWLLKAPFPGPFIAGESKDRRLSIYLVDCSEIDELIPSETSLSICGADFYFIWASTAHDTISVFPVWALIGDTRWSVTGSEKIELIRGVRENLQRNLDILQANLDEEVSIKGGMLVRSNWMEPPEDFHKDFPMTGDNGKTRPVWYLEINHARDLWPDMLPVLAQPLAELLCDEF